MRDDLSVAGLDPDPDRAVTVHLTLGDPKLIRPVNDRG
jgi:hypothetical protein